MSGDKASTKFLARLAGIINQIHAAPSIRDIILEMTPRALELLEADRVTVYAIDTRTNELYSLFKEGSDVSEIRVKKGYDSLAGYCALSKQVLNIQNAYDAAELRSYHPRLRFNPAWDRKTGFVTKQVLAVPILYEGHLMGVLQAINKKDGTAFTDADVDAAQKIAETLGIAFHNQRKMAQARKPNKFAYLLECGLISEEQLEQAVTYARMNNKPIAEVLIDKLGVPKEEVLRSLEQFYNTKSFSYDGTQLMPKELCDRLNFETLRKLCLAPVEIDEKLVKVAMEDPSDLEKVDMVRVMHLAPKYELLVALPRDVEAFLRASYGKPAAPEGTIGEILGELEAEEAAPEKKVEEEEEALDETDSSIVKLANQIIRDAVEQGASDIHVEPNGDRSPTRIRIRVDGVCRVYQEVPAAFRRALVSRLKIMANLDISERRKPQDGKIRFRAKDKIVELRVATIPTALGDEDVVMRILASSRAFSLEDLAFSPRNLKVFKELISKPYGIVLCVGPTGSGKTTTLHAALAEINTPERKIWTAEDPVEITQPGLRQVQVNPKIGFNFAMALRAFLRADPDVIMVGEMRDLETASIGVEASLTGHLVFSTLHTNSAPETIVRLLELGIDPYNFADSLLGVLAQRLVRTLCPKCKEPYRPSDAEIAEMVSLYGLETAAEDRLLDVPDLVLYRAKGCPYCGNTGYRGRMAIHELMEATDPLRTLIRKKAGVDAIRKQALSDGMRTLMQDGIRKVILGYTDMKQVRAVCLR